MGSHNKFSPEVRERAVELVRESQRSHESQWAAIMSVAEKMGCTAETLRRWVRQAERDAGARPGPTTEDKTRIKELEREVALMSDGSLEKDILDEKARYALNVSRVDEIVIFK